MQEKTFNKIIFPFNKLMTTISLVLFSVLVEKTKKIQKLKWRNVERSHLSLSKNTFLIYVKMSMIFAEKKRVHKPILGGYFTKNKSIQDS